MGHARRYEEERRPGAQAEAELDAQRHHEAGTLPGQLSGRGGDRLQLHQLVYWVPAREAWLGEQRCRGCVEWYAVQEHEGFAANDDLGWDCGVCCRCLGGRLHLEGRGACDDTFDTDILPDHKKDFLPGAQPGARLNVYSPELQHTNVSYN